ncbi:hypothetical protein B0T20DRAFT_347959, partial [Sordaria brevicollis]
ILNKFKLNINYFSNNKAKKIYIENRTANKITQNLKPYLADGPYNIKTSNKLFAYLRAEYYNYNRKEKVIYEFNDLKFEISGDFQEFYNKFVRLIGEYGHPPNS